MFCIAKWSPEPHSPIGLKWVWLLTGCRFCVAKWSPEPHRAQVGLGVDWVYALYSQNGTPSPIGPRLAWALFCIAKWSTEPHRAQVGLGVDWVYVLYR